MHVLRVVAFKLNRGHTYSTRALGQDMHQLHHYSRLHNWCARMQFMPWWHGKALPVPKMASEYPHQETIVRSFDFSHSEQTAWYANLSLTYTPSCKIGSIFAFWQSCMLIMARLLNANISTAEHWRLFRKSNIIYIAEHFPTHNSFYITKWAVAWRLRVS